MNDSQFSRHLPSFSGNKEPFYKEVTLKFLSFFLFSHIYFINLFMNRTKGVHSKQMLTPPYQCICIAFWCIFPLFINMNLQFYSEENLISLTFPLFFPQVYKSAKLQLYIVYRECIGSVQSLHVCYIFTTVRAIKQNLKYCLCVPILFHQVELCTALHTLSCLYYCFVFKDP